MKLSAHRVPISRRLLGVFGIAAAIGALALLGLAWMLLVRTPSPSPEAVVRSFVNGAVARHDLAASWRLSTAGEHGGLTRSEWLTGNIPVPTVPQPGSIVILPTGPGPPGRSFQRLYVVLTGGWYMAELRRGGRGWQVDYFGPLPMNAVPQG